MNVSAPLLCSVMQLVYVDQVRFVRVLLFRLISNLSLQRYPNSLPLAQQADGRN